MEQDFSQFLTELKNRLLVSDVVGQFVQLKKHGREWKGLSPFSNEKSPSFTVNDQKQFWHCFSSGEHGDIISFLVKTQNMTFIEAVESLAQRAGLEVPHMRKPNPEQVEKTKNAGDALRAARAFYEQSLNQNSDAMGYLTQRGLSLETIRHFHLGYSPAKGEGLKGHLKEKGFKEEALVEAGLLGRSERGDTYDRFRHRIMFPIDNRKGEMIGFGARALDKKAQAKYLNSPETLLFHKGDNFYGLHLAAKPALDKGQLLITEGYMDVIALHQAGCDYAVASLGTAMTEQQIELAWRFADEPIVCLDGDEAGQRAATRVLERGLKILRPGKSLRFAYMPKGKDPDDVVRQTGLAAFEAYIQKAEPMSDSMFYKEAQKQNLETPERRAGLRKRFDQLIHSIDNPEVQRYYRDLFHRRLDQLFWRTDRTHRTESTNIAAPSIVPDGASGGERILLGLLLDQPFLLEKYNDKITGIAFASQPHQHLCDALILAKEEGQQFSPETFYQHLGVPYHHLLDIIYGRNAEGQPDGHNFYYSLPAFTLHLRDHLPEGFVEQCFDYFIHELYHKSLRKHGEAAHKDYQAIYGDEAKEGAARDRWMKVKALLEEDEVWLLDEITALSLVVDGLSVHMDYASGFS